MTETRFDYDLFVIGGGSGGVRAARIAAGHGARVGLAEEYRLGGTCVIRGCVPKKLLVYASHFAETFEDAAGYGWTVPEARFNWSRLIANKDKEIARLEAAYGATLANAGVTVHKSRAVMVAPHRVRLVAENREVTARYVLIATGGWPDRPVDLPGAEHTITSNEAFHLPDLPKRVAVLGGGYIAVEFAGVFHGLGAKVTQVHRGPLLLRGFDEDLRQGLTEAMGHRGIDLRLQTGVAGIEAEGDLRHVTLTNGERFTVDAVLVALGRRPNVQGLGLSEIGVALRADGAVMVDEWSRTNLGHVYAVGDVTDRLLLTPIAIAEGHAFADTVFGHKPRRVDYRDVATAVFSTPQIGTVGLSEERALSLGHTIDVYKARFRPMLHTMTGRAETVMMKLVVDSDTDRVLGVHLLGSEAGEIIQAIAIAVKMGAKKADFDATIPVHPTAAEELVTMRTKHKARLAAPRGETG